MDRLTQEEINNIADTVFMNTRKNTAEAFYREAVKALKEARIVDVDFLLYKLQRVKEDVTGSLYYDYVDMFKSEEKEN